MEKIKAAANKKGKLGYWQGLYWNDAEFVEEGCRRSNIWAS